MPKQSFGAVRNVTQARMVLKLLPVSIAKEAAVYSAHRVSMKQSLLLPVFLNRASLVSTNNQVQKERWEGINILLYWKDNDEFCILIQNLYNSPVAQRGCRILKISP